MGILDVQKSFSTVAVPRPWIMVEQMTLDVIIFKFLIILTCESNGELLEDSN
jgi:hypothetical protein